MKRVELISVWLVGVAVGLAVAVIVLLGFAPEPTVAGVQKVNFEQGGLYCQKIYVQFEDEDFMHLKALNCYETADQRPAPDASIPYTN